MKILNMETGNNYDEKPLIGTNMSVELCLVCGDRASGRHYGAISCEGCKGFFKRSIRKQLGYQCRGTMNCEVTKHHRNRCQFCRLQKCLASGMRSDSVQHERKPILDKKEIHNSSNSSNQANSAAAAVVAAAAAAATNNATSSLYHHRSKIYQQSSTAAQSVSNTNVSISENLTSVAAAAAAASNLNVFPVGFNFADLTQTLSKRALLTATTTPYQQQQQQQDSFKYSPGTQTNDDDSMDNSNTGILTSQNLSGGGGGGGGVGSGDSSSATVVPSVNTTTLSSVTTATAAAANIIQTSFEKNLLTQSLDLIATVQQQYERISGGNSANNNNNNCQQSINNNNTTSSCSNSIVKEEIIIDEHSTITNRDLIMDASALSRDDDSHHHHQQLFDLPLLPEINVNFNLQSPALVPSYLNVHYVCESGSRLLFLSVYWIKKIPAFQQLSEDIQIKLLRYHWVELFTIGLAQCSRNLSISTIMTTLATNILQLSEIEKLNASKIRKMSEHTYQLNEFVQSMQTLQLDEYEYAYVRLILIFNPDGLHIKDQSKRMFIEKLQEIALNSLKTYYAEKLHHQHSHHHSSHHSSHHISSSSSSSNTAAVASQLLADNQNDKCFKIILRLMQLRSLDSDIIEELFFSNLIGQVQIETMIPYILKLGGGGI